MIYMVCYDIRNPKRLQKTAKIIENYGLRIQYSFFQCEMSQSIMQRMKKEVLSIIDIKMDYFFIYPLCEACTRKAITDGTGDLVVLQSFEII